jgi:hypothetical protein
LKLKTKDQGAEARDQRSEVRGNEAFKKSDLFGLLMTISVIKLILRSWQNVKGFDKSDFREVISIHL